MAEHTPGPWQVDVNGHIRNRIEGGPHWGYIAIPFIRHDEDARLMAAAPDLLAAHIAIRDALGTTAETEAREAADAAIKKARYGNL